MPPKAAPEEVAVLARMAGLDLAPDHLADLVDAYGHLEAMLSRLPRDWAYAEEPAHVFDPRRFMPQKPTAR